MTVLKTPDDLSLFLETEKPKKKITTVDVSTMRTSIHLEVEENDPIYCDIEAKADVFVKKDHWVSSPEPRLHESDIAFKRYHQTAVYSSMAKSTKWKELDVYHGPVRPKTKPNAYTTKTKLPWKTKIAIKAKIELLCLNLVTKSYLINRLVNRLPVDITVFDPQGFDMGMMMRKRGTMLSEGSAGIGQVYSINFAHPGATVSLRDPNGNRMINDLHYLHYILKNEKYTIS